VKLCLEQNPVLFHDQHKTPYARIKQGDVNVTLRVRSKQFRIYLAGLLWKSEEKAPGNEAVHSALNVLESKAVYEGQRFTLYNRAAPASDGFWIDMTDDKWRAIKVTAKGWQIVEDPPILFRRYGHQLPLVEPKHGGDPWKLLFFINLPTEKDGSPSATQVTLLCVCISYLIPAIPHPIIVIYGIQGSGKTWAFERIRDLIDPSSVGVLTIPRNERERVQQLDHHWCAFFDNVTNLKPWMSDTLCRAVTGTGFTKRELYTDDDDVVKRFRRCIGLDGINIAASRGDLLDRSLLVGLHDISVENRRAEDELLAEFESCKAEILGGFLDTLVKAIQLYPSVSTKRLFRMADFTKWGCAITEALGLTQEQFMKAYEEKVKSQIQEAALASPVATVVMDWVKTIAVENKKQIWEGPPSQLYTALISRAKVLGVSTRQKVWPKAPHALVRQLNELAPSLKALGLEVITGVRDVAGRKVRINSVNSVHSDIKTNGSNGDIDAIDGIDAISHTSSRAFSEKLEEIKTWLLTNKDQDGLVDSSALTEKCKQLNVDVQKVTHILSEEYWLFEVPTVGKWGVK